MSRMSLTDSATGGPSKASKMAGGNLFDRLPENVVQDILRRVGEDGSCCYMLVCKLWYRLSAGTQAKLELAGDSERRLQADAGMIRCIRRFSNLRSITIFTGVLSDMLLGTLGASCPDLEDLRLDVMDELISPSALATLFLCIPKLRSLTLESPNAELAANIAVLQNLENLQIGSPLVTLQPIPDTIGNLSSLRKLSIGDQWRYGSLESFPNAVTRLGQLQELTLSFDAGDLPAEFGNMSSLQKVTLVSRRVTELPASFGQLQQLQELTLYCNQLSGLPRTFSQLTALKELLLCCTNMDGLPEPLLGLKRLEILTLLMIKGEDLERLPELPGLRVLHLEKVSGRLHPAICNLSPLTDLAISDYDGWLPCDLGHLKDLKQLSLSTCRSIEYLPPGFCSLTALKTLEFRDMPLLRLPPDFSGLESVRRLGLDACNDMAKLPECLSGLRNLESLSLSRMRNVVVPECFTRLANLRYFQIGYDATISTIPRGMLNLPYLSDSSRAGIAAALEEMDCEEESIDGS